MRRADFADTINERRYLVGAEIGVNKAEYSIELLNRSSLRILYSIDPWLESPCFDEKLKARHHDPSGTQENFEIAKNALSVFGKRSIITRVASPAASELFDDGFFDFIYIDGDHHYMPVRRDCGAWWPKLKNGGMFAGHDFTRYVKDRHSWVRKAMQKFAKERRLPLFVTEGDRNESWWMFKP